MLDKVFLYYRPYVKTCTISKSAIVIIPLVQNNDNENRTRPLGVVLLFINAGFAV